MQNLASGKLAFGILTLMIVGIAVGFANQEPLVVNDFLYNVGLWDYLN
ncbi:MAG: hypothetical protein GXP00_01000 [Alphaproteobacteria bacterium]|nr:hypothetical protein [Alphaproteobacteria bacterium]